MRTMYGCHLTKMARTIAHGIDEVGLHVRDVAQDPVNVVGHLPDLSHSLAGTGLRLDPKIEPRFDAGQKRLEAVVTEPLEVRFRQERQAAFRDVADAAGRDRLFDGTEVIVEAYTEVRVVPADDRPLKLGEKKPQILLQDIEFQGLIRYGRIDAEAAGIRTPQAAEHGNDFEQRSFLEDCLDEGPAFADSGKRGGLLPRGDMNAEGAMPCAIVQNVSDHLPVREAEDIVEIAQGVVRIRAGVGSSEGGDGSSAAKKVTQGVGGLRGLGVRTNENQINVVRQFLQQVFETGVADKGNGVAFLAAPDADHLRHDAGEIGVHDAPKPGAGRSPGHEVEDSDPEFAHVQFPSP